MSPSGESGESDLEDETEAVCERWGCLEDAAMASEDVDAVAAADSDAGGGRVGSGGGGVDSLGGEGVLEARSRDWSGCGCCCCCCWKFR